MRVHFVSPPTFEAWDYRNYDSVGIGGSETAICEMAWRLARRGHEVAIWGPVPDDCEPEWRGTTWHPLAEVGGHTQEEAIWIIARQPILAEWGFAGQVWIQCQDVDYPGQWVPTATCNIDRVMALCNEQAHHLRTTWPDIADKVCVSTNAARTELFEELDMEGLPRHQYRCMYTSSPDRGLVRSVLPVWRSIRELAPQAELHVYYGFDNINRVIDEQGPDCDAAKIRDRCLRYFDELQDHGVVWHGRVGQRDLYRAWLQAGIWAYLTSFSETSCITCMEAQCGGAIPVIYPTWAVNENVRHGITVQGYGEHDPMTRCEWALAVARLVNDTELQDRIRADMVPESRLRCSWENVCDQWEDWMAGGNAPSPMALQYEGAIA